MYTRLNSRRMPSMVVNTDLEWEIAEDKSCLLVKNPITEDGEFVTGSVSTTRHCVHVYRNPALGQSFQIITPDDGPVFLSGPTKAKAKDADQLDWHYKIFIVRVDLPTL